MKFYIKQKVFSLKDKFKIMDENQNELYQVNGKVFSIGNKMELQKMDGTPVLNSKKQILAILPKYFIYTPEEEEIATIKRIFGFKPKFDVRIFGREMKVEGSFFGHSFGIFDGDSEIASIEKKVISWGDTYEIEINVNENVEVLLYCVIVIDQVIHEQKKRTVSF